MSDATAYGHTGTVNGETDFEYAVVNNGLNLHGTGQFPSYISVANASDLQYTASQSFTVSAWVYPSALRSSEEAIVAKSRDQGNYYGLWIDASNRWVFRGPAGDVVGPTAIGSTWTHVTIVQNGSANMRTIYVNGLASGSGAAQAGDGAGPLWIGQQNVSGNLESFPGIVDEIRVYNRALAASEVTNQMGPPVLKGSSTVLQGSAGNYGLIIWPASGKIEPRKGATPGQYNLTLNFSAPVSGVTATLRRQDGLTEVGGVTGVSYDSTGKIVTVTLSGVGNAQPLSLHLSNIYPGNGTLDLPFNVLWGDVNGDNIVNNLDLSIVQNTHTTLVNGSTAFYDVNCDGAINASDDSLVTSAFHTGLAPQTDTNLAIFQPPTALSYNGTDVPAGAFDQSLITRWDSAHGIDPEWIYVNLGAICSIHTVILNWENAAGQNYNIDVTNDPSTTWNIVKQVTGNSTSGIKTYPNLNASAQYVRMYGITRDGPYGYSLYDFQVIGLSGDPTATAPTVNSATTVTALTSSPFTYKITGTNTPTSYSAVGLPSPLTVNPTTGLITGTPPTAGSYTATIKATNASGTGTATLTINVQTSFAAWESFWFTNSETYDPNVSGPLATPANDGISNLMKYALNLAPKANGSSGLPVESMTAIAGQSYLTLTYIKVIAATDITYLPEVSGDLQTWSSGSGATTNVSVTNNPDGKTQTVVVRDLTAASAANKRFIRLKVTKP
ncbi:MAG: discoidin domain-containing protein [Chthoniobacterales bacterium]|nr:discoidin domain-containing protein [Chthoniobacterales bacterium]